MVKRLTFVSQTLDLVSGEWKRQELLGPPDFAAWWRSRRVLRTALLLLQGRSNRGRAAANDILHKLLRKRMNNERVTNPSAFVVSCVENACSRLRGH